MSTLVRLEDLVHRCSERHGILKQPFALVGAVRTLGIDWCLPATIDGHALLLVELANWFLTGELVLSGSVVPYRVDRDDLLRRIGTLGRSDVVLDGTEQSRVELPVRLRLDR